MQIVDQPNTLGKFSGPCNLTESKKKQKKKKKKVGAFWSLIYTKGVGLLSILEATLFVGNQRIINKRRSHHAFQNQARKLEFLMAENVRWQVL